MNKSLLTALTLIIYFIMFVTGIIFIMSLHGQETFLMLCYGIAFLVELVALVKVDLKLKGGFK